MGIWKKVEKYKPVLKATTKDIMVTSRNSEGTYFYVTVNHDNIKNDILARIYLIGDQWYIWYEHAHCRMEVANFVTAVRIIEQEIKRCVA